MQKAETPVTNKTTIIKDGKRRRSGVGPVVVVGTSLKIFASGAKVDPLSHTDGKLFGTFLNW